MKKVVAGVDIGGTNTVFGLVDETGKVLSHGTFKTTDYPKVENFVTTLTAEIRKLLAAKKEYELAGIGIGAPDANYHRGTIEHAPNLAWKGIVPLADLIKKKINVPVAVTNDANAAAMGEMIFGGAKKMKDFIVLTLGTGLGSGIVIDGKMVYGHTGFAGELGHMTVVHNGRECGCGRKGCLETYASATGLVKTVIQLMSEMRDESPLRDIPPSKLTSKKIAEAAAKNDPVAVRAMNETAEILGFGIINAIVFSSPEAIFLFGGLAQAGDLLFKPVRAYLKKNNYVLMKDTVKILPSEISESNGAVLGSAALIWNDLKN
ncbi:MAG TPA: ROK family protein [Bacteroidales bacterium]|nr:ROK family protein [Bacteroidales bacterium]HPF03407.1 ROK family protein [Bacteroidales bacterium]HPJ60005.1 ROK family protein [Bacteroidales bacterium]HPR12928.1 ROK family protein [Bacteroidales bacterium]HRW86355.1 ROK family protein [Bacteroidales bacterium]